MVSYWNLYCSCRQEIAAAASAAAGNDAAAITPALDTPAEKISAGTRHERSLQREHLEHCALLDREKHVMASPPTARCRGVKRLRKTPDHERAGREQEENPKGNAVDSKRDECLGFVAEAFAEELDMLRKDEHFGGSPRDIAAMADMMRRGLAVVWWLLLVRSCSTIGCCCLCFFHGGAQQLLAGPFNATTVELCLEVAASLSLAHIWRIIVLYRAV